MMMRIFFVLCFVVFTACTPRKGAEFFERRPTKFKASETFAVCFVETPQGFLYLKNDATAAVDPLKWTVFNRKISPQGSPRTQVQKLFEHMGVQVHTHRIKPLTTLYIKNSKEDYIYHLFYTSFHEVPGLKLPEGHSDMMFMPFEKAEDLDLAPGVSRLMDYYSRENPYVSP